MIFFCENCGSKLPADARFCENCGCVACKEDITNTKSKNTPENYNIFSYDDWKKKYLEIFSENPQKRIGIILLNTSNCSDKSREELMDIISSFIDFKLEGDVYYTVLDIYDQRVKKGWFDGSPGNLSHTIKTLTEVYNVANPSYLMIIGDKDCIESAKWRNGTYDPSGEGDPDKYIDSDLPYISLNTSSLFDETQHSLRIPVGRIPSSAETGFEEAKIYLKNLMALEDKYRTPSPACLSAEEWQSVSSLNFEHSRLDLYPCPPYTFVDDIYQPGVRTIDNINDYNLLCYNVHGSPEHNYWASGNGTLAFSPRALPNNSESGYVIATEACYGAKPIIDLSQEETILLGAIKNRCLGYVGSTQVAYGATDRGLEMGFPASCADILVGSFAKYVIEGYSLGIAYLKAILNLFLDSNSIDPEELKTAGSFALYGDPSIRFYSSGSAKSTNPKQALPHIAMPNVRAAVNMKLASVSQELAAKMGDFMSQFHGSAAKSTQMKYYSLAGHNGYRAVCKSKNPKGSANGISNIVSVYFDSKGDPKRIYCSR